MGVGHAVHFVRPPDDLRVEGRDDELAGGVLRGRLLCQHLCHRLAVLGILRAVTQQEHVSPFQATTVVCCQNHCVLINPCAEKSAITVCSQTVRRQPASAYLTPLTHNCDVCPDRSAIVSRSKSCVPLPSNSMCPRFRGTTVVCVLTEQQQLCAVKTVCRHPARAYRAPQTYNCHLCAD